MRASPKRSRSASLVLTHLLPTLAFAYVPTTPSPSPSFYSRSTAACANNVASCRLRLQCAPWSLFSLKVCCILCCRCRHVHARARAYIRADKQQHQHQHSCLLLSAPSTPNLRSQHYPPPPSSAHTHSHTLTHPSPAQTPTHSRRFAATKAAGCIPIPQHHCRRCTPCNAVRAWATRDGILDSGSGSTV